MKYKLLSLFLFFVCVSYAENESCLIIKQKGGNETIWEFSTNPIITFEGEYMVVTNDFTKIYVPLDDIAEYHVGNNSSSINDLTIDIKYTNGNIIFSGLAPQSPVFMYSMEGIILKKLSSDDTGYVIINIAEFPKGTYIINANKNRIKVSNYK